MLTLAKAFARNLVVGVPRAPLMAIAVVVLLGLAIRAGFARDWIDAQALSAADRYLSAMPDDFHSVKPLPLSAELADRKTSPFLLDVREPDEFAAGRLPGALNVPLRQLAKRVDALPEGRDTPIVVYCRTGYRGAVALTVLKLAGFGHVRNVMGGFDAWTAAGLPRER
jgi:rhodanese-related sulfurtransferase